MGKAIGTGVVRGFLLTVMLVGFAGGAAAETTIRPGTPNDAFFFHGNYASDPFDPSQSFTVELWNCGNGEMPDFVADREALIVCGWDGTSFVRGELVYSVEVPGGTCVDHGHACYYRAKLSRAQPGVSFFRVEYARRGQGNRVWLESTGDLSGAIQARMLLLIKTDGRPRALLQDTFTPLRGGGWFSNY